MNGQVQVNPLWYMFFANSFGGTKKTILGDSKAVKPLGNMKRSDGSYMLLKSAFSVVSGSDIQHDGLRKMFLRMLVESDKRIYNAHELAGQTSDETLLNLFETLWNESKTKDFDQIMNDMHHHITHVWKNKYGKAYYERVVNNISNMFTIILIKFTINIINRIIIHHLDNQTIRQNLFLGFMNSNIFISLDLKHMSIIHTNNKPLNIMHNINIINNTFK